MGRREALKVSISGVRGIVGSSFTPQVAASFAQAFGTYVGRGPVVVGRDTRPTGQMVECAVVAGLQSVGCRPILAGVVPTPTVLILTQSLGARGGIAITASHNPSPWNALKFVSRDGMFLNGNQADELFDLYHQKEFQLVPEAQIPQVQHEQSPMQDHYQRIVEYVNAAAIKKKRFKVAVDCCNGVGAVHSVEFLRDLFGCEVVPLFDSASGVFEREPEPVPVNLSALSKLVKDEKCDIGFAQDPDGDRLVLVDEHGCAQIEDTTLALAVQQVLSVHEKGPVAINLDTSRAVEAAALALGSQVVRTKIGEINVSQEMINIGAVAGGEGNGGVIIPKIHPCRDSYGGMAVILERMALEDQPVSKLVAEVEPWFMVKRKMHVRAEQTPAILRSVRRRYADQKLNLLDGIQIDFGDAWVHLRRSNTESVVRVVAEARSKEKAEALVTELEDAAKEVLGDGF